jgi:hypothetical protein
MVEASSQIQVHSGHIVMALGWLVIFGALFSRERLAARRGAQRSEPVTQHPQPPQAQGRGWLRSIAACSTVAAAIHLTVIDEHFREATVYGAFFLALTVAQFGFAVGVLLRPSAALLKAGVAACSGVVLLWIATRTLGIPIGPGSGAVERFGSADTAASAAETLAVLFGGLAIRDLARKPLHLTSPAAPPLRRSPPPAAVDRTG